MAGKAWSTVCQELWGTVSPNRTAWGRGTAGDWPGTLVVPQSLGPRSLALLL